MISEKYEFKGYNDKLLSGRIEKPDGEIKAYALFAHCFTCSKNFVPSKTITSSLAERGIATLRFDFTGLGNSQGDFENTNFSSNIEDLKNAYYSLYQTHKTPKLVIGHSLGGAAVLAASAYMPDVTAVVCLAAPYDPAHVLHLFEDKIDKIKEKEKLSVNLFGRKFTITNKFLQDLNSQNQSERISSISQALLIMHSPTDEIVGIENARKIYEAAKHPKSFISLDGIDHLILNKDDADYVAALLASWASRYV